MYKARAYACTSPTAALAGTTIPGGTRPTGTCRSRSCSAASATPTSTGARRVAASVPTIYPCVPGHEIVGRVTKVGSASRKFKAGDVVGVGCLVGSDHTCPNCRGGLEQFCPNATFTYNSPGQARDGPGHLRRVLRSVVVEEDMVLRIPANLDLAGAAPLLCAGITTYSPLRHGRRRGRRSASSASAGSGTWASSSPTRWARTWPCSPRRRARRRTPCGSGPTRSSSRRRRTR